MQLIRKRRFYLDALDAELAVRFELEYRPSASVTSSAT